MSSLVANLGSEKAAEWSGGVVSNFARDPKGSDRDQVKLLYCVKETLLLLTLIISVFFFHQKKTKT